MGVGGAVNTTLAVAGSLRRRPRGPSATRGVRRPGSISRRGRAAGGPGRRAAEAPEGRAAGRPGRRAVGRRGGQGAGQCRLPGCRGATGQAAAGPSGRGKLLALHRLDVQLHPQGRADGGDARLRRPGCSSWRSPRGAARRRPGRPPGAAAPGVGAGAQVGQVEVRRPGRRRAGDSSPWTVQRSGPGRAQVRAPVGELAGTRSTSRKSARLQMGVAHGVAGVDADAARMTASTRDFVDVVGRDLDPPAELREPAVHAGDPQVLGDRGHAWSAPGRASRAPGGGSSHCRPAAPAPPCPHRPARRP
ncbi:hypothetical protein SANTM175S_01774 [Streptomyces antimycoticus]